MTTIPCYCTPCGLIFESTNFINISGNVTNLTISNVKVPCPKCRKPADMLDGVFNSIEGVVSLVSGSDFSKGLLERFTGLVQRAQTGDITITELEEQSQALGPEIGALVVSFKQYPIRLRATLLLALCIGLTRCSTETKLEMKLDVNQLFKQAAQAVSSAKPEKVQNSSKEPIPDSKTNTTGDKPKPK